MRYFKIMKDDKVYQFGMQENIPFESIEITKEEHDELLLELIAKGIEESKQYANTTDYQNALSELGVNTSEES